MSKQSDLAFTGALRDLLQLEDGANLEFVFNPDVRTRQPDGELWRVRAGRRTMRGIRVAHSQARVGRMPSSRPPRAASPGLPSVWPLMKPPRRQPPGHG
jgi:hypothetical protein